MTTRPDEQAPATEDGGNTAVPFDVHLRTIEAKNRERDAAYACGYDTGFLDGLEAGLRATVAEARAALGTAG